MLDFFAKRREAQERAERDQLLTRLEDLDKEVLKARDERDALRDAHAKEVDAMARQKTKLEAELETLRNRKKIEEEDIQHMLKMRDERKDLEVERKIVELEKTKAAEIAQVKDQYRDKLETHLIGRSDELREMYREVLARLPDVNVRLRSQ